MKLLLANPHGFCAGVVMAIRSLERALEVYGPPIYVFHEIVHNTHVVQRFRGRGVIFIENIGDVPEGERVIFSAHGIAPDIRREARIRNLQTIDATCPLVHKVHTEAVRFAAADHSIILIGHAGHDEAVGTMGEAPELMTLVETVEDVDRIEVANPDRVAYLTQTTLSVDDAQRIIDRLKERFPNIVGPPKQDICFATQNRQEAVTALLHEADVVLVIGSANSSNSNRLAEIARDADVPAHLIDGPAEIRPEWLDGAETVVLTAGASAPEEIVEECLHFLEDRYNAHVEPRSFAEEHAHFPLPQELRQLEHTFAESSTGD
ncbi:MAG: 4-hydroxy-3-methylbut-2-enyl diphosphate reductase [Planctomycetaceae bacterium]